MKPAIIHILVKIPLVRIGNGESEASAEGSIQKSISI